MPEVPRITLPAPAKLNRFLHITGRLKRFAKIGGEMVPLERVQEHLSARCRERLGDEAEGELAVSAAPDASRGEKIVVLHTGIPLDAAAIAGLAEDLPPLFRPRSRDVHRVEALPVLGSGKLDLRALSELAAAADRGAGGP